MVERGGLLGPDRRPGPLLLRPVTFAPRLAPRAPAPFRSRLPVLALRVKGTHDRWAHDW